MNGPASCEDSERLAQAAIRCYLSLLLTATDSMAEVCPEVGVAFKRRWARAPLRLGFDRSIQALEESAQAFEHDVRAFGNYAARYFQPAPSLLRGIAGRGSQAVNEIVNGLVAHYMMLRSLAEALLTTVDLQEEASAVRSLLEHQAAGLLHRALKVESEILPRVSELQAILVTCQDLMERSTALSAAAGDGVLNPTEFSRELMRRRALGTLKSLVRLSISAVSENGRECSDDQFAELTRSLSTVIPEQYDSDEAIGLVGREFLVLSNGTIEQAVARRTAITNMVEGEYHVAGTRLCVQVQVDAADSPSEEWAKKWLADPEDVPVEFPIRAPSAGQRSLSEESPAGLEIEMIWVEGGSSPLVSA